MRLDEPFANAVGRPVMGAWQASDNVGLGILCIYTSGLCKVEINMRIETQLNYVNYLHSPSGKYNRVVNII